jgi:hypothetical protein
VIAWLTGKRRARLVWANWKVSSDDVEHLSCVLEDLAKSNFGDTLIVFAMQANFEAANKLGAERKIKMNPKATIGWSTAEEQAWQGAIQASRRGRVIWAGDGILSDE